MFYNSVFRFPDWSHLPSVYLSPTNKGFSLPAFVSTDIGLALAPQAPLPWSPPICEAPKSGVKSKLPSKYNYLTTIFEDRGKEKQPDESIKTKFLISFKKEEDDNIAELGARIKAGLEKNVRPVWLLSLLAANYWRITGKQIINN